MTLSITLFGPCYWVCLLFSLPSMKRVDNIFSYLAYITKYFHWFQSNSDLKCNSFKITITLKPVGKMFKVRNEHVYHNLLTFNWIAEFRYAKVTRKFLFNILHISGKLIISWIKVQSFIFSEGGFIRFACRLLENLHCHLFHIWNAVHALHCQNYAEN